MKNYTILPHTADVRLKVEASSLKELFSAALDGMNSIMKHDGKSSENKISKKIKITSPIETFDEDVKAVTYHEAQVKKNEKNNYEVTIIFDI